MEDEHMLFTWQEPYAVIDASGWNVLTVWYPKRNRQETYFHIPGRFYGEYAYENFDSTVRPAHTMPWCLRWTD